MIRGVIGSDYSARLTVAVAGRKSIEQVEVVLDSGFNGDISVPKDIAVKLGLELTDIIKYELADGSIIDDLVFISRLLWEGKWHRTMITLTDSEEGLLGTAFLAELKAKVNLDFDSGQFIVET